MSDDLAELRRDIAEFTKSQAVHQERMENGQDRMIEKLGEAVEAMKECAKNGRNGGGYVPRNGNGGIPAKFVLQVIGLLLLAALAIGGGSEGVKAGMKALENITKAQLK